MSLDKKQIRRQYQDFEEFLRNERNRHRCGCGCNEVIELKKSHFWNGIPEYIFGHAARLRKGVKEYDKSLYYSVEDIAELANVSDQTVRLWNRNGKIIASKTIGRKNLYDIAAIDAFLDHRPEREQFDPTHYYTVQELKRMGVSRSKLRRLVRAGEIQEPRHHSRKTHYLIQEIEDNKSRIMEDPCYEARDSKVSKKTISNLLSKLKDLEERVKMIEDCMLQD